MVILITITMNTAIMIIITIIINVITTFIVCPSKTVTAVVGNPGY